MAQKISIHIGGRTPDEAIAEVEGLLDVTLVEEDRKAIRLMVGFAGRIPRGQFFTVHGVEGDAHIVVGEAGLEQISGEKLKYNGVLGDSCPCVACNLRRQQFGPERLRDMEELNIDVTKSKRMVEEGYAAEGRSVPPEAMDSAQSKIDIQNQERREVIERIKRDKVNARTRYSVLVNDDPVKMSEFDRVIDIATNDRKLTEVERMEAAILIGKIMTAAIIAYAKG